MIIDIAEARRELRKTLNSSNVAGLISVDCKRIEIERFVYESLNFLSCVGGPDAIDRIGERLILQIASRITADCGRVRVLEMLETIAAATAEVCSGPGRVLGAARPAAECASGIQDIVSVVSHEANL